MPNALSRHRSTPRTATTFALVTMLALGAWAQLARPGWWLVREPDGPGHGAAQSATAGPRFPSPDGPLPGPNAGSVPWVGVNSRAADAGRHELTGSLNGRTWASLTVRDAASRVEVRMADLPGLLYRVSTPADSGLAARVTGSAGRVRVGLRPTDADGPDNVTIVLSRAVRWDIRLAAGAGEQHLDLAQGRITRLELGAAGLIDLRLPPPTGTVPVTLTDGAGSVEIAAPHTAPVRIRLRGGAGTVTTSWTSSTGTPRGAVLTSRAWAGSSDRYAVDARAAVGALTLR
ncbi:MAG TPA: hypothetical protein VGP57_05710 [Actinoplanes sp.]|nr:hypothetical protein [Actinoplanes sp.]